MLFSVKYADRCDLFEGLTIWEDEKFRKLQGSWPVILYGIFVSWLLGLSLIRFRHFCLSMRSV